MNYEKLLESTLSVYKASTKAVDALEEVFLKTLIPVVGLVFLGHVIQLLPAEEYLAVVTRILSIGAYLLAILSTIPFILSVIQATLKRERSQQSFLNQLRSKQELSLALVVATLAGIATLVLLPYLTGLAMQIAGYESNILATLTYALLVLGLVTFLFTVTRLMGVFVYMADGKEISMSEMFTLSQAHFMAILMIIVATTLPLEALAQFLLYSLSGLTTYTESLLIEYLVTFVMAFVRGSIFLLQMYLVWTAFAGYMKDTKLLK